MAEPIKSDLVSQLRLWIKRNAKESSRLEFKLKLDNSNPGVKAEFIRDVIALANSEGETPRDDGYLVVGFKDGRFHERTSATRVLHSGSCWTPLSIQRSTMNGRASRSRERASRCWL